MRKTGLLFVLLAVVTLSVPAQGLYLDAGLGFSKGWTKFGEIDIDETFAKEGIDFTSELTFDLGLRAGFGPLGSIPLYIVGEFSGMGYRVSGDDGYLQLHSFLIGPGIIFYPVSFFQLGASVGYSFTGNLSDLPDYLKYESEKGYAWNVSAAFDLGFGNSGLLLGIKYFSASNILQTTDRQESSMISFFVKYAFRQKVSKP